ncbi:hypothetical protein PAXINDRAFT_172959 [Paxillus involutus ATCC 200175]|uniref:Uncharacterized protein n=1 Tax=Paxillus involutus ATCC 200175 TaxID=664439 RepID=A0A0C9SNR3_PAXIN|nr:hypothetical protein PAXINDRAFT_172959 [Paxillus involutus ATCC 200175]
MATDETVTLREGTKPQIYRRKTKRAVATNGRNNRAINRTLPAEGARCREDIKDIGHVAREGAVSCNYAEEPRTTAGVVVILDRY